MSKKVFTIILTIAVTFIAAVPVFLTNTVEVQAANINYTGARFAANKTIDTRTSLSGPTNGWIDPNDDCVIVSTRHFHNGVEYWLINYPIPGNRRKNAYALRSDIMTHNINPYTARVRGTTSVFRFADLRPWYGEVWSSYDIWVLNHSGPNVQIIYPVAAGGFRIGWIPGSALVSTPPPPTPPPVTPPPATPRPTTTPPPSTERTAWVTTSSMNLNVRSSASASASVLGQFRSGQQVTVTSASPVNGFYSVRGINAANGNTITGFASAQYIGFAAPPVIDDRNATNAQVRTRMIQVLYNGRGGVMSCDYDGYRNISGRHNGIDFVSNGGRGTPVHSLTNGVVTRVHVPSSGLSTIAIYDEKNNKTIIYLHIAEPKVSLNQDVTMGMQIATESDRGGGGVHTHVEVRNGRHTHAAISVGATNLSTDNPYPYWRMVMFGATDVTGKRATAASLTSSPFISIGTFNGHILPGLRIGDIDGSINMLVTPEPKLIDNEIIKYSDEFYDISLTEDVG
jgi:hypothetical protein